MFQPRPVPATPFVERVRTGAGRRTLGLGLTLLIEALMLLLLLTLGPASGPGSRTSAPPWSRFTAEEVSEEAPEPQPAAGTAGGGAARDAAAGTRANRSPRNPPNRRPRRAAPAILPMPWQLPPSAAIPRNVNRPAPPARPVYGPPDNRSAALRDTERVGTAPNGEPLYAAEWYREPDDVMMRAYLSTARGPGWGLIACRTAPDYRVEDCVALSEYPEGSQINRSVLAAAWEFRVRPPRRGGRPLVGSWVRIRISYDLIRR